MKAFLLAMLLVVFETMALCAQGIDGEIVTPESACPWPPPGAKALEYRVFFSQTQRASPGAGTVNLEEPSSYQVRDRQELRDEPAYARVFGKPSGIDWTAFRIVVMQLTTTYKLGKLYSAVTLSAIDADVHGIYVGLELTEYEPPQGTAQLDEWFSYDRTDLFLLLPARPSEIVYYSCPIGTGGPAVP